MASTGPLEYPSIDIGTDGVYLAPLSDMWKKDKKGKGGKQFSDQTASPANLLGCLRSVTDHH